LGRRSTTEGRRIDLRRRRIELCRRQIDLPCRAQLKVKAMSRPSSASRTSFVLWVDVGVDGAAPAHRRLLQPPSGPRGGASGSHADGSRWRVLRPPPCLSAARAADPPFPAADAFEERGDAVLQLLSPRKEVSIARCLLCWRPPRVCIVDSGRQKCFCLPDEGPD
jgi:hypothetical protein